MKIDKKLIKELTDYLNEFNLTELEYGNNETKIKVSKLNPAAISNIPIHDRSISVKGNDLPSEIKGKEIKSPIIGTVYLSPEPGAKKFIEVGKKIKKGDTIMIVEAMKTMNHVPSPSDGIVKKICVEDSAPVEFGQTIAIID